MLCIIALLVVVIALNFRDISLFKTILTLPLFGSFLSSLGLGCFNPRDVNLDDALVHDTTSFSFFLSSLIQGLLLSSLGVF